MLHKQLYTPRTGGSEDGDGKGEKTYRVTGTTDGPGSVSTLVLVRTGDDYGESVDDDDVESEGVAEARAAARRMRTAEGHMGVEPVDLIWDDTSLTVEPSQGD